MDADRSADDALATSLATTVARHVTDVVVGVIEAEVARAHAPGVVLASPPGPAATLLQSWLSARVRVVVPSWGVVGALTEALGATGTSDRVVRILAHRFAAEAMAENDGSLPVAALDRTSLLLDTAPLPARALPLGDLYASELHALGCPVSLPAVLSERAPEEVRRVEAALSACVEDGVAPRAAFGPLGGLGVRVHAAFDAAARRRHGLLVPKLRRWTAGIDPDR